MSMRHTSWIASTLTPRRNSSPIWKTRSGVGIPIAASRSSVEPPASAASAGSAPRPRRPCSSERNAFCRLSVNVRPIAITSPTDCICVPSTPDVPGSFSNAQRGIFVTT